jgi:uncharacterized protein
MTYLHRKAETEIANLLTYFPAVAIVGPRQVGKTSLAKYLAENVQKASVYFDLEDPDDRAKFANPKLILEPLENKTVILDEVQRFPDLFPILRGAIDRNRQAARFILLGAASPDLIRDASETLAGRIAYYELSPFLWQEVSAFSDWKQHFFRGGFHGSLLAPGEELATRWRNNFITTYLERDLPMLGLNAEPTLTRRLWQMAAHLSGSVLNMETISSGLGISNSSVRRYLDFFESSYLIRRLQPYLPNLRKRLIRSPKLFLRDTGILHQLLGISSFEQMIGNPIVGASWETYVIEQIAGILPEWAELFYYRTQDGTEADLVITRGGIAEILVEIKFTTTPKMTKSLHIAKTDLATNKNYIICPIPTGFPLAEDVKVLGIGEWNQIFENND